MSTTHGGKAKEFDWFFQSDQLVIKTKDRKTHQYSLQEVIDVLSALRSKFGHDWYPLANNIQKMYEQTERPGLGSTIYALRPGDTYHAQGASYLGVALEEAHILEWNGRMKGIEWRIVAGSLEGESIRHALEVQTKDKGQPEQKTPVPLETASSGAAPALTADDLARLRSNLIKVLNKTEKVSGQKEGLASRINRLARTGFIPREIAPLMLAVSEARNVTEYEAKHLSPTEAEAVRNSWKAVLEWAHSKGITIES